MFVVDMKESILNIIEIIVKHIFKSKEKPFNENEVVEYLLSEGYNIEEINAAFSWIREILGVRKVKSPLKRTEGRSDALRVLTPAERMNFSPDAYGFVIRLKELGFIDDEMQEEIIERAQYLSDIEIGLDEIKSIVAFVIMSRSGGEWGDDINRLFNDEWESSLN